jgi:hypothetical protein
VSHRRRQGWWVPRLNGSLAGEMQWLSGDVASVTRTRGLDILLLFAYTENGLSKMASEAQENIFTRQCFEVSIMK